MRLDPSPTVHGRYGDAPGTSPRSSLLVTFAIVLAMCAGLAAFLAANPVEFQPHRGPLPYTERDSIVACGRGAAVSACLASESALRPRAQALWKVRPAAVQRFCMRHNGVSVTEPVGALYACLAANEDEADLRR